MKWGVVRAHGDERKRVEGKEECEEGGIQGKG